MIADADPFVREMVSRFITEAGYRVTLATQGYEALDDARKILPAAILADILLPKLDGLTLCRLLKGGSGYGRHYHGNRFLASCPPKSEPRQPAPMVFILKPLEKISSLESFSGSHSR